MFGTLMATLPCSKFAVLYPKFCSYKLEDFHKCHCQHPLTKSEQYFTKTKETKIMAKTITSIAIFLLAFSLLIFSVSVEGGTIKPEARLELQCNRVIGVKSGDTCFDLAHTFKLSTDHFNFINPNLNCSALFVGQWLCLNAFLG